VGRSNKKAFAYLLSPPLHSLSPDAKKRLKTIEEFADLGSGIRIAMRDLDIRGAGNLLGGEQSGFIAEIGFDMYQKILNEAIQELKEKEYKELFAQEIKERKEFVRDVTIDSDIEMMIPDNYVSNINERLALYTQLDNLVNEEALHAFKDELADRFGKVPREVNELFDGLRLRWLAKGLGFERIVFKSNTLRCYFIQDQQSPFFETATFQQILNYIQNQPGLASLKQSRNYLILRFENVFNMYEAQRCLKGITQHLESAANSAY
jgi:transcription-repair coupling factor (superfamily II helicase)